MTSLPTVPITQTSEGMAPTTSDKSKYQSSSTSHPSRGGPAVDMGPYQKFPLSNPLANNPALDLNVHHPTGAQPPQLRTPLASEPAEQWASSTIYAVTDDNIASNASTPGLEVPGAYPSLFPSKETVQQDLEYAREVAASALSTASGYATAAGNTVVTAVTSAKQPATNAAQTVGSGVAVAGQATADTATAVGSSGVDAGNTFASGAVSAGQATAEATRSAGQSASSSVSAAPHTVVSTMKAAGATAASYLPPAIASYLPGFSSGGSQTISHSTAVTDPTGNAINGLEGLHGTSFAKLPEETRVANEFHYSTTAIADPTGNTMNGLEGLSGQSLAKLPEERVEEAEPIPYASERRSKTFSASYLNPVVVPDSGVHSSRNAPEATANAPSTHQPMLPSDSKFQSEISGADTDASTRSLVGTTHADSFATAYTAGSPAQKPLDKDPNAHSMYHENDAHRGTFENKPLHESVRSKVDPHIETLRQHDAAKKSANRKVTDTIVSSVKDDERKVKKAFDRHAGTGESKPLHESVRNVHTVGHAPPVPQKDVGPATGATMATGTGESSLGSPSATTNRTSKGSFGSEDSMGKKVGFMNKVKGEMKVLSGKLTNKEDKIEEGRRLMGRN